MDGKLEGKRVIIFYSDGQAVSRKDGIVTSENIDFVFLNSNILIPKNRIVRVEIQ